MIDMTKNIENDVKQIIVVRKDLNMPVGKVASQVAHASMKAIFSCADCDMEDSKYETIAEYTFRMTIRSPLFKWLDGIFTKIVVGCENEKELLEIYNAAEEKSIICSLIEDSGRTVFKGPTITCAAIGPAENHIIDELTGHLKLYK